MEVFTITGLSIVPARRSRMRAGTPQPQQRLCLMGINDEKRGNEKRRCNNGSCEHNTTETSERRRKGQM